MMKIPSWIAAFLIAAIIFVIAAIATSPLWAQSTTLPATVEIRPTLCPCQVVLLDAPRGVSGMVAEFTDSLATVVGPSLIGAGGSAAPPSTNWIFISGVNSTIEKVTRREIWQASWTDTLDEIGLGSTDVVLLTYNIPLTAAITSLVIDDDDGNVIVVWP